MNRPKRRFANPHRWADSSAVTNTKAVVVLEMREAGQTLKQIAEVMGCGLEWAWYLMRRGLKLRHPDMREEQIDEACRLLRVPGKMPPGWRRQRTPPGFARLQKFYAERGIEWPATTDSEKTHGQTDDSVAQAAFQLAIRDSRPKIPD